MPTSQILLSQGGGVEHPIGEDTFESVGTFTWTAPAGCTKISVAGIGGGSSASMGGGGGGLGYKNNISVSPGTSYTVVVGGGASGSNGYPGNAGGNSYITIIGTDYGGNGGGGGYAPGSAMSGSDGGADAGIG